MYTFGVRIGASVVILLFLESEGRGRWVVSVEVGDEEIIVGYGNLARNLGKLGSGSSYGQGVLVGVGILSGIYKNSVVVAE